MPVFPMSLEVGVIANLNGFLNIMPSRCQPLL